MRRIFHLIALVLLAAVMLSCGKGSGRGADVQLSSAMDSLSYSVGVSIAQEYRNNRMMPHLADSVNIDQFLSGIDEGTTITTDQQQLARYAGILSMFQLDEGIKGINRLFFGSADVNGVKLKAAADAFLKALEGQDMGLTISEAQAFLQDFNRSADVSKLATSIGVTLADAVLNQNVLGKTFGLTVDYNEPYKAGVEEALRAESNPQEYARLAGIVVGRFVAVQRIPAYNQRFFGDTADKHIDEALALKAFKHSVGAAQPLMDVNQASAFQAEMAQQIQADRYVDNKTTGEQFLAVNRNKEGVRTTASGLQYKVLRQGEGAIPTANDVVLVNYEGRLIDGTVFDASDDPEHPMELPLNELIDGWNEALQLMPVGSEWEIYIPQQLAYGNQQVGEEIKPFSTLIYKVTLREIKK